MRAALECLEICGEESDANSAAERNGSTATSVSLARHRFITTAFNVGTATDRRFGTVGQRQVDASQQDHGHTSERIQLRYLSCISRRTFATVKLFSHTDTTRAPRARERDGVDYHFVTEAQMRRMIDDDGFAEYAIFSGNYYGTRCAVKFCRYCQSLILQQARDRASARERATASARRRHSGRGQHQAETDQCALHLHYDFV